MCKIGSWLLLPAMMILWTNMAVADERADFRSEVLADEIRENYQATLVGEERIGEYQLEKTIVDVHGQRVRIEEYLLRPAADQIKFLTLNTRANRFDYGYQTFTFDNGEEGTYDVRSKSLEELSSALWMCFEEEPPKYWVAKSDMRASNTMDQVDVNMTLGKPIRVTIELPPLDEEPVIIEESGVMAVSNEEPPVEGEAIEEIHVPESFFVYLPSYVKGELSVNGKLKERFSESTSLDGKMAFAEDYITADGMRTGAEYTYDMEGEFTETYYTKDGAVVSNAEASDVLPEYGSADFGNAAHYSDKTSYKDGTWLKYEEYLIDDEGKVITWNDFGYLPVEDAEGEPVGDTEEENVQDVDLDMPDYLFQQPNREMIISASEFEGRTIDLVIAPMEGPEGMPIDMFMW